MHFHYDATTKAHLRVRLQRGGVDFAHRYHPKYIMYQQVEIASAQ